MKYLDSWRNLVGIFMLSVIFAVIVSYIIEKEGLLPGICGIMFFWALRFIQRATVEQIIEGNNKNNNKKQEK